MWGVGVVLHGHNNHVHAFSVVLESRSARHAFAALIDVSVCGRRIGLVPSMMLLQSMKFFFFLKRNP